MRLVSIFKDYMFSLNSPFVATLFMRIGICHLTSLTHIVLKVLQHIKQKARSMAKTKAKLAEFPQQNTQKQIIVQSARGAQDHVFFSTITIETIKINVKQITSKCYYRIQQLNSQ